jgi:hypothetical protein
MAQQDYGKRRRIATASLTQYLYVPDKEAHRVDNEKFIEWNRAVVRILEDTEQEVGVLTDVFVKTQTAGGMQAPSDVANWRQSRFDQNAN